MINITKEDKDYIESTNGVFSSRGICDTLDIVKQKFGEEMVKEVVEEMKEIGHNIDLAIERKKEGVSASSYVMLLLVIKKHLQLNDNEIKELGVSAAKISFLLRFASKLMISIDVLFNNSNIAWKKYYFEGGELFPVMLDKINHHMLLEVRNFTGHPVHCRYLEGYIQQIVHFVTNKEAVCKEEECIFEEGKVHRYKVSWD